MRKPADVKGKDDCERRQTWKECSIRSVEMVRYANGWQKGEIFLPKYIALNNSV